VDEQEVNKAVHATHGHVIGDVGEAKYPVRAYFFSRARKGGANF